MKHPIITRSRGAAAIAAVVLALASLNSFAAPPAANVPPATAPAPADDIRDIRGPIHIESPWSWVPWLAGGAALAALGFAAWKWQRKRALAAMLPFERALESLEKARALMQPENAREYSIAVSEIVRSYVQERFNVSASRRTTEEFLHDLLEPSDALLAGHRALLADFLRHCDLAKFARWILSGDEMEGMYASARTFILETGRPQVAAPTAQLVQAAAL